MAFEQPCQREGGLAVIALVLSVARVLWLRLAYAEFPLRVHLATSGQRELVDLPQMMPEILTTFERLSAGRALVPAFGASVPCSVTVQRGLGYKCLPAILIPTFVRSLWMV